MLSWEQESVIISLVYIYMKIRISISRLIFYHLLEHMLKGGWDMNFIFLKRDNLFTKLYSWRIVPILDYAPSIWGFKFYGKPKTSQHRLIRFLVVHIFAPNDMIGEIWSGSLVEHEGILSTELLERTILRHQ